MRYCLLVLSLLLGTSEVFSQDWESSKTDGVVKAFTMVREKGIKEVKVTAEIDASLEKLVRFITDYENPKEWKHSTKTSKVVDRVSDSEFTAYFVISTPWPLRDRDFYARVNVENDPEMGYTEILFQPDVSYSKKSNRVRMTNFETKWTLKELSPGKTFVELYSYGDPIGIPTSLVNMFIVDTPFKTVQNLKTDISSYK